MIKQETLGEQTGLRFRRNVVRNSLMRFGAKNMERVIKSVSNGMVKEGQGLGEGWRTKG